MHIGVMPNEKYEFITNDLARTTAEQKCFISGVSHHPCSTFESGCGGRYLNAEAERPQGGQSSLVQLREELLRSWFLHRIVEDMIALPRKLQTRLIYAQSKEQL